MSDLIVRPSLPDGEGNVLRITPESAGWSMSALKCTG